MKIPTNREDRAAAAHFLKLAASSGIKAWIATGESALVRDPRVRKLAKLFSDARRRGAEEALAKIDDGPRPTPWGPLK